MTTTTTSGAAIQRYKIGYHADEWGQRSSTPSGIPDASGSWVRYADHIAALAAGQAIAAPAQPAAQQGVAYAALPEPYCNAHDDADAYYPDMFSEQQMRAFADATHTLRASHGQAPAGAAHAADSVPAVEREQERIAFKDAHRHLELYEVPDAWGRPMFKHSHVEASWLGWIARASHGQASSQAGGYTALVCDYCGALTPDPWHSSGMLHGKMSKHIHSCDACAARGAAKAQAAKQQEQLI